MRNVDWQAIRSVSEKTKLKPASCHDLLQKGWTYIEGINAPGRWISPAETMKEDYGKHEPGTTSDS